MEQEQRGLAEANGRLAQEKDQERQSAVEAKKVEVVLRHQAEKQAEELRQGLYFAGMNLAGQAALSPGGIGQVSRWLGPWEKDAPDLRNWEWYYLKGLCHRDLLTLRGHSGGVLALAWGKDDRLASAGTDHIVRIWNMALGQEVQRFDGRSGAIVSLAWARDGKRLASARADGTVTVLDAVTGRELLTFRGQHPGGALRGMGPGRHSSGLRRC
jgi:hypothetical protein